MSQETEQIPYMLSYISSSWAYGGGTEWGVGLQIDRKKHKQIQYNVSFQTLLTFVYDPVVSLYNAWEYLGTDFLTYNHLELISWCFLQSLIPNNENSTNTISIIIIYPENVRGQIKPPVGQIQPVCRQLGNPAICHDLYV
jgi:hypothetical protein